MKLGVENTAGIPDFREQIEFGPEEDVDTGGFGDCHVYPPYRRLKGPNQWPPETCLPSFRPIVMEFMKQMGSLSMHLMQALALSLGLDQGYFDADFKCSPHYQLKVARYPPKLQTDSEGAVEVFGVGPHSDTGFLSLLLQDQVGGLQAQNVNGDWIDVPPKSGTFVVNLGEMLQLATNGYYLATVHRVLSLPGTASRYSVPFFFNPQLDAEIKSMDLVHLISTGLDNEIPSHEIESRYELFRGEQKRVCEGERSSPGRKNGFVIKGGESTHGGKNKLHSLFGTNAFKSFARSHPEVVRRHHPDLVVDSNGLAAAENIASDSSLLQLGP